MILPKKKSPILRLKPDMTQEDFFALKIFVDPVEIITARNLLVLESLEKGDVAE